MMDWQMRTNSSGLSGVNAMRFQKPVFLLTSLFTPAQKINQHL
jgi:hypothetical protein